MLARFERGSYQFIVAKGMPFSFGVLADSGFGLVRAVLKHPLPLRDGLSVAKSHVESRNRPVAAIGGFELRIPEAFTREGFDMFNSEYVELLKDMGLSTDVGMPAARTNVAPTVAPVSAACVYAFTYSVPQPTTGPSFRLSGCPETRSGSAEDRFYSIAETLEERMGQMRVDWEQVTCVNLYGDIASMREVVSDVLKRIKPVAFRGVHWFPALPPVIGSELEVDVGAVETELLL